jgi:hypothetical protein
LTAPNRGNAFGFLPLQFHTKHPPRKIATVYVVDTQVLSELAVGARFIPHFDIPI